MIEMFRLLRHWLDQQNFPEFQKLDVTISVRDIDGCARLRAALERECSKQLTPGVLEPIRRDATFTFEVAGIPANVVYREGRDEGLGQLAHDILNMGPHPALEEYTDAEGNKRFRRVALPFASLYKK